MTHRPAGQVRRTAVTVGLPALAAGAALYAYLRWLPQLPDRLATHFGAGMRADGFTDTATFPFVLPAMILGIGVVLGLIVLALRARPDVQRVLAALAGGFATMLLTIGVLTLHLHLGVTDAAGLRMPGWHLVGVVGGLLVGGGLGWVLCGSTPQVEGEPPADGEREPRPLGSQEVVHWRRTVRSPAMGWLMVALSPLVLITCVVASWWLLVVHVPVYVLLLVFARVTVVVDDAGLSVRLLGGWPRVGVAVSDIRSVHSAHVDALGDFGGWGWRSGRDAGGIVLRSGPALYVYRRGRRPLVVTVGDADEAAALLNGLRDRYVVN